MKKYLKYCLAILSISTFILGFMISSYNTILIGILILFFNNIFYCFENIEKRVFFMFFNIMIFVFLLSRPTISMIKGTSWWYFDDSDVMFAMNSLMLTLISLLIGHYIGEKNILKREKSNKVYGLLNIGPNEFRKSLCIISVILFYISISFYFTTEAEKLLYMRSRDYVEIYRGFKSSLPYVVTAIGSMHKYLLCIYLASMPNKRESVIPLGLYILSAVPSLIIGLRNPIVLNIIFVVLYYFIRDALKSKEKWLGIFEKSMIMLLAPLSIIMLGAYNYIREGKQLQGRSTLGLIVDFFYKQGVSFDVLCIGHNTIPKIKYTGPTNYTFGGIIDYFTHNTFAQTIWGAASLGTGNNIMMGLYSNNFAHRMSYASKGKEYLEGHGWGSSYILETYADFGYAGIIIFSIFVGMLFAYIIPMIKRGSFTASIVLIILTGIYFCPRDAALGWINFIFYAQFIVPAIICFIGAKICIKKYSLKNHICLYNQENLLKREKSNYV